MVTTHSIKSAVANNTPTAIRSFTSLDEIINTVYILWDRFISQSDQPAFPELLKLTNGKYLFTFNQDLMIPNNYVEPYFSMIFTLPIQDETENYYVTVDIKN